MIDPAHTHLSSLIAAHAAAAEQHREAHMAAAQAAVRMRGSVAPILDSLLEDIARITTYYDNFAGAILDIERLLHTEVEGSVSICFYRLLYVNVITALETYLSDAFINTVPTPALMRRFIETTPEFQNQKIRVSDVFKVMEEIELKAKRYMIELIWHHLDRIKPLYLATLGVEFPPDSAEIFRAILTRHDIVHRNGKTKDGDEIILKKDDIVGLIATIKAFVQHIDQQLRQVGSIPGEDRSSV